MKQVLIRNELQIPPDCEILKFGLKNWAGFV